VFNDLLARTNGIVCDTENHQLLTPYWDEVGLDDQDLPEAERQFAEIFRTRHRYVVADALDPVDAMATLIEDDPMARLREIKAASSDDLMVAAGPGLLASLFDAGLVNELGILVLPIVLGNGTRQVGDLAQAQQLSLIEVQSLQSGSVFLRYQVEP
jgi:riboflavin biosynthesis pyrimidine reductase